MVINHYDLFFGCRLSIIHVVYPFTKGPESPAAKALRVCGIDEPDRFKNLSSGILPTSALGGRMHGWLPGLCHFRGTGKPDQRKGLPSPACLRRRTAGFQVSTTNSWQSNYQRKHLWLLADKNVNTYLYYRTLSLPSMRIFRLFFFLFVSVASGSVQTV